MKGQTNYLPAKISIYFSSTPRNVNLKAFVTAVGGQKNHRTVLAIDETLLKTKPNLESAFKFWDTTFAQCNALIEEFESGRVKMAARDADRIASDWRDYQKSIHEAILSVTTTKDAILVEVNANIPAAIALRLVQLGWEIT